MKMNFLAIIALTSLFLSACQQADNFNNQAMFSVQPKTSAYYTSDSAGSNGPAFQLVTVTNTQQKPLIIRNIEFIQPNSSITIAGRQVATNHLDVLYGKLPQCSVNADANTNTVNQLLPGESCGILLQGITYDPRKAAQSGQLTVNVSFGLHYIQQIFNLSNVTHIYANPFTNQIGTVSVPADKYVLADCSNNSQTPGQALTCINALGSNKNDNFLTKALDQIRIFPNGNMIVGGRVYQIGRAQLPSEVSGIFTCQPDSDQCRNALANGTRFVATSANPQGMEVIDLDSSGLNGNAPNSAFFVTGKFNQIINDKGNIIAQGTGIPGNFVAYCVMDGTCKNIMPDQSVSDQPDLGDGGIYGLAFNNLTNTVYFGGTFNSFTGLPSLPGNHNFPIVSCLFNGTQCTNYANYFASNDHNPTGFIFGLNSLDSLNELEIGGSYQQIGNTSTTEGNLATVCQASGSCLSVTANGLTLRGSYDKHSGLLYIPVSNQGNTLGSASTNTVGGLLAACPRSLQGCFDVLGGGTNGAFNHGVYPTYDNNGSPAAAGTIAAAGAQLAVTTAKPQ